MYRVYITIGQVVVGLALMAAFLLAFKAVFYRRDGEERAGTDYIFFAIGIGALACSLASAYFG